MMRVLINKWPLGAEGWGGREGICLDSERVLVSHHEVVPGQK